MKRVLIIGTGDIGELHLRCFQKTGRVSLGICEINDNLCRRVADQYGIAHASVSLEEAMELHKKQEALCLELGNKGHLQASYGNQAVILRRLGRLEEAMAVGPAGWRRFVQGPWPMVWGAVLLALLNLATLGLAGHPWTISFGSQVPQVR